MALNLTFHLRCEVPCRLWVESSLSEDSYHFTVLILLGLDPS